MHRTTAATALGACALVLAACSSGGSGASPTTSATTSSTTGAAATSAASSTTVTGTDYSALSLTAADFPSTYPLQQLDAATTTAAFDGLSGNNAFLKVSPPECASTNPFASADSVAVVEAQDSTAATTVDVFVGRAGGGLSAVQATVTACPTVTVTSTGSDGASATGQGTQAVLPPPPLEADSSLAFRQDVTLQASGGQSLAQSGLTLAAQVGDTVVVVAGNTSGGQTLDTGLLDGLLTKAVAKVRAG